MAPIKGGWTHTSYSNDEPYSRSFVAGFSREFSAMQMENLGTYPGNANNEMIQQNGDQYIEVGNIAVMQSHGSVWGPDLTYLPSLFGTWWYDWGGKNKLQWVLIGGCDCLGYAKYPNGQISDYHPRVDRWDRVFQGVSGVLGYRSDSWYQPTNTSLADRAGSVLARRLTNGASFVEAWRTMATYVHRSLGRRAEVAVFASSKAALQDNLVDFEQSRPKGVDQSTISTQVIGAGSGPTYSGYCPSVDFDGTYTCTTSFLDTDSWTEIFPGIYTNVDLGVEVGELPEYSCVDPSSCCPISTPASGNLRRESSGVIGLNSSTSFISSEADDLFDKVRPKLEEFQAKPFSDCSKIIARADEVSKAEDTNVSVRRFIVQDGWSFPVLDECGIVCWQNSREQNIVSEFRGARFVELNTRRIGFSARDLQFIFQQQIQLGSKIYITDIDVCYRLDLATKTLKPGIALYVAEVNGQTHSTYLYVH